MKNVPGVLSVPHTPMDINRETVVQLYFQSSPSRERFYDDQPVKLLHPDYTYIAVLFPAFARTSGGGKAEGREQKNKRIASGRAAR